MGSRYVPVVLLPLALAAALPFTFAFSTLTGAESCIPVKAYAGSLLNYSICNVPDLDQRRTDDAFVSGLPNGGKMYCVPASSMNWMTYIANHGYPQLFPGPGNWGPESGPAQPHYNTITQALTQLGGLMNTDPSEGTDGYGGELGIKLWLLSASSGDFVVSAYYASGFYAPLFTTMATAALDGALVSPHVGWYVPWTDAPPEVKELFLNLVGGLPKGYYRNGGHVVSMVMAEKNAQLQQIGLRDPASPNNGATASQSEFATDEYPVVDEKGTFDNDFRVQSRIHYLGSNAYMDGYYSIKPKYGLTVDQNQILLLRPIALLNDGFPQQQVISVFESPTGTEIVDLAIHPERPVHPFLVEGSNTIWQIDTLTGRSSRFATVGNPRRLAFGARDQRLYVLLPRHIIALGLDGIEKHRVLLREPVSDVAYDRVRRRVVAVSAGGGTIHLFDEALQRLQTVAVSEPFCRGRSTADTDPQTGTILLHCEGSSVLRRLFVGDLRSGEKGIEVREIELEAAQRPTAFAVDDRGHFFVSDAGVVHEYDTGGNRPERSRFTGLPGGQVVDILRSFSNFDPRTMRDARFRNVLPEDARR